MRNKYKLDPTKYDFIYRVSNFDYFLFSLFLKSEYCKKDFIFTCQNNEWKAYLSKQDHTKTAKQGEKLMENSQVLNAYLLKANLMIKTANRYFKEFSSRDLSKLTNESMMQQLKETSAFVASLWSIYLPTEYFYYDTIEEKIRNKTGTKIYQSRILKNVKRMQKIKYELRIQINKTIFDGHIFSGLFTEIAKRLKIKREDLYHLSHNEIIALLKGEKIKRENRSIYIIGKFSKGRLIIGARAKKLIDFVESFYKKPQKDILTGQVGNKGYYKGRVKIILLDLKLDHYQEIKKMKKGDVLVSGSTGPEMILACRKAGAIITEEGGITSHAAIVSRELDIPSVIGTKVATEVLKDGDIVEVDANHGIVKIIKKQKK